MLKFKHFLDLYLKHSVYGKINAVLVQAEYGNMSAYHYYAHVYNGKTDYYINMIDEWTYTEQMSPINNCELIVDAIIKQDNLHTQDISYVTFTIIRRDKVSIEEYFYTDLEEYTPKAKFIKHQIQILGWENIEIKFTIPTDKDIILLEDYILYESLEECTKDFKIAKLFVNSLKQRITEHDSILKKDIFDYAGVKEQTFYNWQKSKPKLVEIIMKGYLYSKIEHIVKGLISIPKIQHETWGIHKKMTYLDGEEF